MEAASTTAAQAPSTTSSAGASACRPGGPPPQQELGWVEVRRLPVKIERMESHRPWDLRRLRRGQVGGAGKATCRCRWTRSRRRHGRRRPRPFPVGLHHVVRQVWGIRRLVRRRPVARVSWKAFVRRERAAVKEAQARQAPRHRHPVPELSPPRAAPVCATEAQSSAPCQGSAVGHGDGAPRRCEYRQCDDPRWQS
jgi:hypothetical protein